MTEHKKLYRSFLGQSKGLGPAHNGTHHWWMQRLSAMALMPCGLWLVYILIDTRAYDQAELVEWLRQPLNAILMLFTVWAGLYHSTLGLQVVLEDYIHHHLIRTFVISLVKIIMLLLAVAALVAIISCRGAST